MTLSGEVWNTHGMNNAQTYRLARQLLDQHGYKNVPVKITTGKSYLGKATQTRDRFGDVRPTLLSLSGIWMKEISDEEVIDTILHEIAHFKAGFRQGHGAVWKAACRAIGANPSRVADLPADLCKRVRAKHAKYTLTCVGCGQEYHRNRKPNGRGFEGYSCGKCRGKLKVEVNR